MKTIQHLLRNPPTTKTTMAVYELLSLFHNPSYNCMVQKDSATFSNWIDIDRDNRIQEWLEIKGNSKHNFLEDITLKYTTEFHSRQSQFYKELLKVPYNIELKGLLKVERKVYMHCKSIISGYGTEDSYEENSYNCTLLDLLPSKALLFSVINPEYILYKMKLKSESEDIDESKYEVYRNAKDWSYIIDFDYLLKEFKMQKIDITELDLLHNKKEADKRLNTLLTFKHY